MRFEISNPNINVKLYIINKEIEFVTVSL